MADFSPKRPFGVDHGELNGLSPQQCFVLGYELALVDAELATGRTIARLVHGANQHRIRAACHQAKRVCRLAWMSDDRSEAWMWLSVPAVNPTG